MTKLELVTVPHSVKLALKTDSKEDVEQLIDELIRNTESEKKA